MENKPLQKKQTSIRYYFIDEGGDSTLFSSRGKVLIGTSGCSRFFILGLLDVPDSATLHHALDNLRVRLVNDSYFNDVPSMQTKARKTALAFQAKDDLPEVRRDVFRILRDTEGLRFFAVVADKWRVLHTKSRSMQRLWCGEKMKKSQGYRITRTAARQSHGYGAEFRPLAILL